MKRAICFGLALMVVGCSKEDPTQVMVRILADSQVADAGGTLTVTITDDDGTSRDLTIEVGEDGDYPFVIALAPRANDPDRSWAVVVELDAGELQLSHDAVGTYDAGRVVVYDIVLTTQCAEVECGDAQTCVAGRCRTNEVDTTELPDYEGPGEGIVDGGTTPIDGGTEDAGDMDAGSIDSGVMDAGDMDAAELDAGTDTGAPDAGGDAGSSDAGTDAGSDAGPCGSSCQLDPCFTATTVDCSSGAPTCERPTMFRTSGACGIGMCIMDGYCAIDPVAQNRRPAGASPAFGDDEAFAEWISLSGDRLITGTPRAGLTVMDEVGRVIVFRAAVDAYAIEQELDPPAARAEGDEFGRGVAIDGVRAVVHFRGGFAVYERDVAGWELVSYVTPSASQALEGPIALSGDRLVAATEDGARIYELDEGIWEPQTPDVAPCVSVNDVSIDGDLVALACFDDTVQIYSRSAGGTWIQRTILSSSWGDFGQAVDIAAPQGMMPGRLIIGALGFISSNMTDGRAFYYEMGASPSSWNERGELVPRDHVIEEGNRFGIEVELIEDGRVAVSATDMFWGSGGSAPWTGTVFVFDRDSHGQWFETLRFTSNRRVNREHFGGQLSSSGDRLAASSSDNDNTTVNGAFYVFDIGGS